MTTPSTAEGTEPWAWLRGDLHTHCEVAEQTGDFVDSIDPRLDFVALTNHGQKPVFFEQHHMVADLRQRWSSGIVLSGVEWNAPQGGHACVVFPPHTDEAGHAYALARGFDRHLDGARPDIAAGMAQLGEIEPGARPVLCFNHPAPGQWSSDVIAEYRSHDVGGIVVGLETVHGHQGYNAGACFDLATYPGCAPGGLADTAYGAGPPFSLLAHSDFHIHKQDRLFDYAPGVFNHTLVGVPAGQRTPEAIFAGLRAGRTCAAQGHWLQLGGFSVIGTEGVSRLGDTWAGGAAQAVFEFDADEPLDRVDWLGSLDGGTPGVVAAAGPLPPGHHRVQLDIPAGARGFLRLRVLSASHERPAPGPTASKGFFTSAILLDSSLG
ncbi:MAG TPA: hypothetical protein QGF95_01275 [Candidatus Latescibacteria bacterium]|jgi:hypothetical protein|nr:hypothetical protein [Gemmatimonadaceae bacterium]MDP6015852.1 hypothetical protein [Candidatus Latescibacterota bacterium]HJP29165.1 hypothetical protein [Candidatus Latescibacterota bacterium]